VEKQQIICADRRK